MIEANTKPHDLWIRKEITKKNTTAVDRMLNKPKNYKGRHTVCVCLKVQFFSSKN